MNMKHINSKGSIGRYVYAWRWNKI